ncbi:uncharacterized protein [Aegilops tauschii subsp. strangulata]|uniref:uncharacterized protein n=1 Tax=Aegilops tauschii subsp. strangulata TaxID=200361 RepID=UPI003CC84A5C
MLTNSQDGVKTLHLCLAASELQSSSISGWLRWRQDNIHGTGAHPEEENPLVLLAPFVIHDKDHQCKAIKVLCTMVFDPVSKISFRY